MACLPREEMKVKSHHKFNQKINIQVILKHNCLAILFYVCERIDATQALISFHRVSEEKRFIDKQRCVSTRGTISRRLCLRAVWKGCRVVHLVLTLPASVAEMILRNNVCDIFWGVCKRPGRATLRSLSQCSADQQWFDWCFYSQYVSDVSSSRRRVCTDRTAQALCGVTTVRRLQQRNEQRASENFDVELRRRKYNFQPKLLLQTWRGLMTWYYVRICGSCLNMVASAYRFTAQIM